MRQADPFRAAAAVELRSAFARARSITIECGLAYAEVDAILDIAEGTFRTMCASMPADHPAEGRMRILADVLDYAVRLLGDRTSVAIWLRTPHDLFGGSSPLSQLVEHPEHVHAVRNALRGEWNRCDAMGHDGGGPL